MDEGTISMIQGIIDIDEIPYIWRPEIDYFTSNMQ